MKEHATTQVADRIVFAPTSAGRPNCLATDLGRRSGISRDTLTRLEGGDGGVSIENVLKVLRGLGILDVVTRALDPYESDVGRLRLDRELPRRVRPISLTDRNDG